MYLGDTIEDATIAFAWNTFGALGQSITRATDGTIKVRRLDDGTDCTGTSVTDTEDTPDTGIHECIIDTNDNANYTTGNDYAVWLDGAVIDGQTVNATLAIFSIENRSIGSPISLDSGTATIAGMLTKMADDNAGADFDAETDSLNKIQTAVASGFPTAVVATAENFTTPAAATSGSFTDTALDNGVYLQVAGNGGPAVGGFGMNMDLTFALGTDRTAATVFVNAKEDLAGVVLVWAWNYLTSTWDQISDANTGISGTSDADYTYILLPRHQEVSTGDVNIRFTSTSTQANKYLYLDQVLVTGVSVGATFTPAEIAQAVWEQELGDIHAANADAAGHIVKDIFIVQGDLASVDITSPTIIFTLNSNAVGIADAYNGMLILIEDATDGHYETRRIINYTAGRVATVDRAFGFTPAAADHYEICGTSYGNTNVTAIDSTAQRATDLAEIAQYLFANSVTLTDIIADNSVIAQSLATSGDISGYVNTTDTQQAIRDAISDIPTVGQGDISVDHDTGGTDNLAYKTAAGAGIDNAIVRAYLTTDYDAGSRTEAFVKGTTTTTTTGRWSNTMRLDAGDYTFEFSKQGAYGPDTTEQAVS